MAAANPESLLLAEHSHDASQDLLGDGWHGVMNYAGFTRPIWQWLKAPGPAPFQPGPFTAMPRFPGGAITTAMRSFAAAQPWRATAHALTLVDSHDTMRIRTLLHDPALVTVAFGLLATMPGIPMLWAGDEIGQEGVNGEDARRPIPWNEPERWDLERFAINQALFTAPRGEPCLTTRWPALAGRTGRLHHVSPRVTAADCLSARRPRPAPPYPSSDCDPGLTSDRTRRNR